MRIHWKCIAAQVVPKDGRVLVLVDFWRDGEQTPRREELLLEPADGMPLDAQLRRRALVRAEAVALERKPPVLDALVTMEGTEEV